MGGRHGSSLVEGFFFGDWYMRMAPARSLTTGTRRVWMTPRPTGVRSIRPRTVVAQRFVSVLGGLMLAAATLPAGVSSSAAPASNQAGANLIASATPEQGAAVLMQDNFFSPRDVTIATGRSVTWTNAGRRVHNAASTFPEIAFDGPFLGTNDTFTHSFTSTGIYHYDCVLHAGMSGTVTVITDGAPSAPVVERATPAVGSATVSWTATSSSGAPITGFIVRVETAIGVMVRDVGVPDPTARSWLVTGLRRGAAYRFRVAARNAAGASLFSDPSNIAITPRQPFVPRIGPATAGPAGGPRTATARWLPPLNNGGSPVTGYVLTALRMSATNTVIARTTSPRIPPTARSRVFRLPAGRYRFSARARNAVGSSAPSARSNLVPSR
jgi:plastocyanin